MINKRFYIYRKLLRLYPKLYREQYGNQMLQTLADMLEDAKGSKKASIWLRTTIDLPLSLGWQQFSYIGGIMNREVPHYVKRNSLISLLLLLPFFIFIITNPLISHRLYYAWPWSKPILVTWIVIFPAAALCISILTYLTWQARTQRTFWRNVVDYRHNWFMFAIGGISVFILATVFGHDSVHCLIQNPSTYVHNARRIWHCVQQR